MSVYSPSCEKSFGTATEHLPTIGPHNRNLIFAVPVDPHARKLPIDRKLIQKIFYTLVVVRAAVTPLPAAGSGADKVHPDAWDVRD